MKNITIPKRFSRAPNLTAGFGILEIVVAVFIISAALFSIMTVARLSLELNSKALWSAQAGFLLEEGSEGIRMLRDGDWTNISALSSETPYALVFENDSWESTTTLSLIDGMFYRTFRVNEVYRDSNDDIASSGTLDPGTKKFLLDVSWWNGRSTTTKNITFYLADIFSE